MSMRIFGSVRRWRIRRVPRGATVVPASTMSDRRTSSESHSIRELFGAPGTDNYDQFGPVHECLCGCDTFLAIVHFEDGAISGYFTDGRCASCHADVRLPTEVDSFYS